MELENDLEIHWQYEKANNLLGSSLDIRFSIINKNPTKSLYMGNLSLSYGGDHYFLPCAQRLDNEYDRTSTTMKFQVKGGVDNIPSRIQVVLKDCTTQDTLSSVELVFSMDRFTEEFFPLDESAECANILLFGPPGSCKSSFINSCYTLFNDRICQEIAPSGGNSMVTTTLQNYRLVSFREIRKSSFRIFDAKGLASKSYLGGAFERLLDDQDAIIFFVTANALASATSDDMIPFVQIAKRYDFQPILAISKMDQMAPNFRKNPRNTYQEVENLILQASRKFGILPQYIFPLINYESESSKSFEVDIVVYKLLLAGAKRAKVKKLNSNSVSRNLPNTYDYQQYFSSNRSRPDIPPKAEAPTAFVCPISGEVMNGRWRLQEVNNLDYADPVVAADGFTYEREYITQWLQTQDSSPMTNAPLQSKLLVNNHAFKSLIIEWKEK